MDAANDCLLAGAKVVFFPAIIVAGSVPIFSGFEKRGIFLQVVKKVFAIHQGGEIIAAWMDFSAEKVHSVLMPR